MSRRSNHGSARQYPRTARLNELLREILADELEHLDDDRLQMLTITSVDIDGDLRRASVFYDSLAGEDGDEEVLEALGELRWKLQRAIGREAHIKRTPERAPPERLAAGPCFSNLASAACNSTDTSPISSSSKVPPPARLKAPSRAGLVPADSSASSPKSSDRNSPSSLFRQATVTKGPSRRTLAA